MEIANSHSLWGVADDGAAFKPLTKINSSLSEGKFMLIDRHEDTDDGTFLRAADYTRLVKRIDDDIANYLTWALGSRMKNDWGEVVIKRASKTSFDAGVILNFKTPIDVCFGVVSKLPVTQKINQIKGEINIEWFHFSNGRQSKYANGFEVYMDCKEFNMVKNLFKPKK